MAKFQPGVSGNPRGRPRGSRDKRTVLRERLQAHADEILDRVVELAKQGDPVALRLAVDRLVTPVREDPVRFPLPPIARAEDCAAAQAAVLAALAEGALLPSEADTLTRLIESLRRAFETGDLATRLERIEAALAERGASQ